MLARRVEKDPAMLIYQWVKYINKKSCLVNLSPISGSPPFSLSTPSPSSTLSNRSVCRSSSLLCPRWSSEWKRPQIGNPSPLCSPRSLSEIDGNCLFSHQSKTHTTHPGYSTSTLRPSSTSNSGITVEYTSLWNGADFLNWEDEMIFLSGCGGVSEKLHQGRASFPPSSHSKPWFFQRRAEPCRWRTRTRINPWY